MNDFPWPDSSFEDRLTKWFVWHGGKWRVYQPSAEYERLGLQQHYETKFKVYGLYKWRMDLYTGRTGSHYACVQLWRFADPLEVLAELG